MIAELILMNEKDDELKDILKEYLQLRDEISYLEDILDNLYKINVSISEIKRHSNIIKNILPNISKSTDIPDYHNIVNFIDCIDKYNFKNFEEHIIKLSGEIESLKDKFKKKEKELENILLKKSIRDIGTGNLEKYFEYLKRHRDNYQV